MSGDVLGVGGADFHDVRTTLARFDKESEKELKSALSELGTEGRRLAKMNAPVRTGALKGAISKRVSFTGTRSRVAVTINMAKLDAAVPGAARSRYPFIVEHGRKTVRPFEGRHYLRKTRHELAPRIGWELDKAKAKALRVVE